MGSHPVRVLPLVIGLAFVALCALGIAVDDTLNLLTEKPGTLTVDYCAGQPTTRGRTTYDCVGEFHSRDGSLVVKNVHLRENIDLDKGDKERVTLAGPAATEAHPVGYYHIFIAVGVAAAAITFAVILLVRRRSRWQAWAMISLRARSSPSLKSPRTAYSVSLCHSAPSRTSWTAGRPRSLRRSAASSCAVW